MLSKKYNCLACLYKTDLKYNFNRHMVSKHNNNDVINTASDVINTASDVINTASYVINTASDVINTASDVINSASNVINTASDNECIKCCKILSSKNYLQKHLIICKGVSNPLECHLCHKLFANSSSKSHHLKICKGIPVDLVLYNNSNDTIESTDIVNTNKELLLGGLNGSLATTNNIISNNIISNNNSNNTTYNINLVSYDAFEETINFDISHLTKEIFEKIIRTYCKKAFYIFCLKLFENKNNQLIIKENFKYSHSKIHTGFKVWTKIYDKHIYPIIMTNISETMILFLETYKSKQSIKELIEYLDSMATTNGYSATKTAEYKQNYNLHIKELKFLFNTFIEKENN